MSRPSDTWLIRHQLIRGSTFEQQNTWYNMASTISGIGLMTVSLPTVQGQPEPRLPGTMLARETVLGP